MARESARKASLGIVPASLRTAIMVTAIGTGNMVESIWHVSVICFTVFLYMYRTYRDMDIMPI